MPSNLLLFSLLCFTFAYFCNITYCIITAGSKRKVLKVKDTVDGSPEQSQKAKQTAKVREEARKRMLAERRAVMKLKAQQKAQEAQEVEIFLPNSNSS